MMRAFLFSLLFLSLSHPIYGQDYENALRELSTPAASLDTQLIHNSGVRYLLLHDHHLTVDEFEKQYESMALCGRLRLMYVATRGKPQHFPINNMSKVYCDKTRSAAERWMAFRSFYVMYEFVKRYARTDGERLALRKGRAYGYGSRVFQHESIHEKWYKNLTIGENERNGIDALVRCRECPFLTEPDRTKRAKMILGYVQDVLPDGQCIRHYGMHGLEKEMKSLIEAAIAEKRIGWEKGCACYLAFCRPEDSVGFARRNYFAICESDTACVPMVMILERHGDKSDASFIRQSMPLLRNEDARRRLRIAAWQIEQRLRRE